MGRLSWKRRLVYWSVILVIPLATVELGFRGYFAHQLGSSLLFYGTRLNRQRSGDAHTGDMNLKERYFKYHPYQERFTRDHETGRLVRCTINRDGFRGRDFAESKHPDVTRIVSLGASSTFGFHNRDDQTYPSALEQILNRPSRGARSFEVINLAIPHLDSGQIRALFEEEALPLHPDVVTFYEGINDSWRSPVLWKRESEQLGFEVVRQNLRKISFVRRSYRWARNHFVTLVFMDALAKKRRNITFDEGDVDEHIRGKSENFLRNVSAICHECRKRDILFVVASQQAKSFLVGEDDIRGVTYDEEREAVRRKLALSGRITRWELYFLTHTALMRDLEDWCKTNGVPFVDVIAALDPHRDYLVSWVHLNAQGNRIVAEAFASEILNLVLRKEARAPQRHFDSRPRQMKVDTPASIEGVDIPIAGLAKSDATP